MNGARGGCGFRDGGVSNTLSYDANGNTTTYDAASGNDTFLAYDGQNRVTRITVGASSGTATPAARDEFWYDPDGQRFLGRELWDEAGVQKQARTVYLANFEEVIPASGSAFNLVQRTDVSATVRQIRTRTTGGSIATRFEYVYRDHLGSVDVVTNSSGSKLEKKLSFDPFGGRREETWGSDILAVSMATIIAKEDERYARGFTDHEMLNRTGFVHMNGRVYDPRLGRFVSPDPIVQFPTFSQSYNRYSYVLNSPLSYTDPSGFKSTGVGSKCEECVGNAIGVIGAVVAVVTGSPVIGAAVSTILRWMSNNSGGSAGSITTGYVLGPPPPGGGGSGETGGTGEAAYGVARALAEGDNGSASAEVVDDKWAGVADSADDDWTEDWFASGNHRYRRQSTAVCEASSAGCTLVRVVTVLNTKGVHPNQTRPFVPGQPYVGDVDIFGPFGEDHVSTTAVFNSHGVQIGVRNETLENHALHPGVVERTVILKGQSYYILTEGGGYGMFGGPNIWLDDLVWGPVDQRVLDEFR